MPRLPRSNEESTMTSPMTNQGRTIKILLRGVVLTALALGLSGCYVAPYPGYYGNPYYGSPYYGYYGGYYAPYSAYPYYPAPYYYGPSVGFVYRGGGRWR
jgi:hypothetical protein